MFKKLTLLGGIAVFALIIGMAGATTSAAIISDPGDVNVHTLDDVNAEGGVLVGDKLFDEFRVTGTATSGTVVIPNAQSIGVTGVLRNGELGLRFQGPFSTGAGEAMDVRIKFRMTVVDPNFVAVDNTLELALFGAANGGQISISEGVYDGDPDTGANLIIDRPKFVFADSAGGQLLIDHKDFIGPFSQIWVVKDITLDGDVQGFAQLSDFYQTFSQIPEPSSLALVAGGVLLLIRRRRRGA